MGKNSQAEGDSFEQYFAATCNRQGFSWIKLLPGAQIYGRNSDGTPKWKLVRCNFDYLLAGRIEGLSVAAYIDTKSIGNDEFPKTLVDWDQINDLLRFGEQGHPAGYVIHFRKVQKLVYIPAQKILDIGHSRNLTPGDGKYLGNLFDFDLKLLWS